MPPCGTDWRELMRSLCSFQRICLPCIALCGLGLLACASEHAQSLPAPTPSRPGTLAANPSSEACTSSSCSESAGAQSSANVPDAGSPTAMRDCAPIACPPSAPWNDRTCDCREPCDLEHVLAKHLTSKVASDCGVLAEGANTDEIASAQRCVLDAMAAQRSFELIWSFDPASGGAQAYVSLGGSEPVAWLTYGAARDGVAGAGALVGELLCRSFELAPNCQASDSDLCLRCQGRIESSMACDEYSRPPGACHGPGNYSAGKGNQYVPCCPGLREVFQQVRAEDGAGQSICADVPARIYACVEGSCGDGRCEEPEAVPCGCPQDCPSASVESRAGSVPARPCATPPCPAGNSVNPTTCRCEPAHGDDADAGSAGE